MTERTIRVWDTQESPMRDTGNIAFKLARVFGMGAPDLYVGREPVSLH